MRYRFDQAMRQQHKWRNMMHSALLLGGMGGLVALSAYGLLGLGGMIWTLIGAGAALLLLPRADPRWVMRAYRARPLDERTFPKGARLVRKLAAKAELETVPRLHYIPSQVLNAFATGTADNPAIGITDGMLRRLTWRELAGVLAHEISHVRNNDLWLMGLADLLSRLTSALSYVGMILLLASGVLIPMGHTPIPFWAVLLMIVAPTFGSLLQLAFSRAREYDADLEAATLTGDPQGLASALAKLQRIQGRYWEEIFLPGRRMPDPSLLRTHPPTEERINRLLSLVDIEPEPFMPAAPIAWLDTQPDYGRPGPPRLHWTGCWR